MSRFAAYSQDYILVRNENGPGDVKQKAVGLVTHFATTFPTRKEAKEFLNTILFDDRAEGYQSEHWIGQVK